MRRSAVALGVVLALLLSGCTLFAPHPTTVPTVRVDTPEVPAEFRLPGEQVTSVGGVAPEGSRPALLALSRQVPGRAPRGEVWSSSDGQTWTRTARLDAAAGEAVTSLGIVASDRLAVVGGQTWATGVYRPALWTSTDGRGFDRLALPSAFGAGDRLAAYAAVGSSVIVIAIDPAGAAIGAVRSGGRWTTSRLPELDPGLLLTPVALGGSGHRAVLIAQPAPSGGRGGTRSYTSTDGGRTWTAAGTVTDRLAEVTGAVVTASSITVTGSTPNSNAADRPVVWSSEDGAAWTEQQLTAPAEDGSRWTDTADVRLDSPSVGIDRTVSAVMVNEDSGYSTVWTRGSDGSWVEVGQTGGNSSNGEDGVAFSVGDGRYSVFLGGDTWGRAGIMTPAWADGTVFATRNRPFVPGSASAFAGGVVSPATRLEFALHPDASWQSTTVSRLMSISATGKVRRVDGVPPEAAGLGAPVYGAAGEGGVVLGNTWDGVGPIAAHGFASTDGSTWTATTGFPDDGATEPNAVARIGGRWITVAARRADTASGTPSRAAVFESADGVSWSASDGDFGSGVLASTALDICEAPDGAPVAVGWVERSAGLYAPAAWTSEGGRWTRMDLGTIGSADGQLDYCAGDGTSLTVVGVLGGRSTLVGVDRRHTWKVAYRAPAGDAIGRPVRVRGGFAASGSLGSRGRTQAVVWLSRTGTSWNPVAVPALQAGSTDGVAALGDDLVVTMSPAVGAPVAIVRDIRSVIEQNTH